MNTYTPDKWVIIQIASDESLYKVAGFWSGGYADPDSYRVNSGITAANETDDAYEIGGYSGSVYICRKGGYGTNAYGAYILNAPAEQGLIRVLSEEEAVEYLKGHKQ